MAQSLAKVLVHLVFSTKERRPWIDDALARDLYLYLAATARGLGCPAQEVGGTADHVHIVFSLSRTVSLASSVEDVKKGSSKWAKTRGEKYRDFAWQGGYGAFSIGESGLAACTRYIREQAKHHERMDFKVELRKLLRKYGVEHDERYLWD